MPVPPQTIVQNEQAQAKQDSSRDEVHEKDKNWTGKGSEKKSSGNSLNMYNSKDLNNS